MFKNYFIHEISIDNYTLYILTYICTDIQYLVWIKIEIKFKRKTTMTTTIQLWRAEEMTE